ncbi:hypothetical protein GCM10011348_34610 [Marinobacterium nitratireducens]|uniref:Surface antigen domain-containing protein n=1 Tax=Marinobacterium nitratireducens TaxID=518897 RepID=A0A917ZKI8_9GAMM|nr:hypothetical protein [Marinobacterium nitratireducens]GGO85627.1 hypothetical protein GCM10011348_34610 [Marinobacterium nitratireducens]
MTRQDELQLQAWMDGELPAADRDAFAERLAREPRLQRQAESLQSLDRLLRQAYAPIAAQRVPTLRIGKVRPSDSFWALFCKWLGTSQPLRWQPCCLLLLAAISLAGAGGYWLSGQIKLETAGQANELGPRERQALQLLVDQVLEHQRSGSTASWQGQGRERVIITPTRTFRTPDGDYCREFSERLVIGDEWNEEQVIACREGEQRWSVKARYY